MTASRGSDMGSNNADSADRCKKCKPHATLTINSHNDDDSDDDILSIIWHFYFLCYPLLFNLEYFHILFVCLSTTQMSANSSSFAQNKDMWKNILPRFWLFNYCVFNGDLCPQILDLILFVVAKIISDEY